MEASCISVRAAGLWQMGSRLARHGICSPPETSFRFNLWPNILPPGVNRLDYRSSATYTDVRVPAGDTAMDITFTRRPAGDTAMDITCSIPLGPLGPARINLRDFLAGGVSTPMDLIYPRSALDSYGRDMTAAVKNNNNKQAAADPVTEIVGRDGEIDRVVSTLCRRSKNNAVLVGAPGVGKAAIAEGLAQRVAAGTVPPCLVGARVVELDLAALLAAGTTSTECWRGGGGAYVAERVEKVVREAERAADGKVILFIDEMHLLLGDGDGGAAAASVLKTALARGRLRCVGATTVDEYRRCIETDAALERRFQRIDVEEPSADVAIAILRRMKRRYEAHHGLKVMDSAIVAAVHLAARFIPGRQFPDKAVDLIDEACATTRMQIAAKQKELNSSRQADPGNKVKVVVCPEHVAQSRRAGPSHSAVGSAVLDGSAQDTAASLLRDLS